MIPFDSNGWHFNFDLDLAWVEIMELWNLVRGVSFSFNLPDLQLVTQSCKYKYTTQKV